VLCLLQTKHLKILMKYDDSRKLIYFSNSHNSRPKLHLFQALDIRLVLQHTIAPVFRSSQGVVVVVIVR